MDGLARPTGDHVGVYFSCEERGHEQTAGTIAGEVAHVHDRGIRKVVELPEQLPATVPAGDRAGTQRQKLVLSIASDIVNEDSFCYNLRTSQVKGPGQCRCLAQASSKGGHGSQSRIMAVHRPIAAGLERLSGRRLRKHVSLVQQGGQSRCNQKAQ